MKTVIFSAFVALTFMAPTASATTCKLLELNQDFSGASKKEAQKKAWNACIDNLLAKRASRDGDISVDAGLGDAEHCINDAKVVCR